MSRASHQLLISSAHTPVLGSHTVADGVAFPGTATATINFFESGMLRADTTSGNTVLASFWANQTLGGQSIASLYEIFMSAVGLTGDALNTWISMAGGAGGARSWSLSRSTLGASNVAASVQIRNAATQALLAGGGVNFTASVSSP